jgi:hypothetical protein
MVLLVAVGGFTPKDIPNVLSGDRTPELHEQMPRLVDLRLNGV